MSHGFKQLLQVVVELLPVYMTLSIHTEMLHAKQ